MDVQAAVSELGAFLDASGHRWFLGGALALQAYGSSRFTADADLIAPSASQDDVVRHLEKHGYATLYRSAGFSNHLHPDRKLGRIDLIYVDERTERLLSVGARRLTLFSGGPEYLVPKPEHLIAMKAQAIKNDPSRRLRDLADIAYLLSVPGVDRSEARGYFERLGLQEAWDELDRG